MTEQTGRRQKLEPWRRASEVPPDPDEFAATVGESIRRMRQERGWTQVELAGKAGLSANYVARLERGELSPSFFVACRIAEAFDVPLELMLGAKPAARSTKRRAVR
jgi:transcriptional regulator with XRE-family HTH domain